MRRYLRLMGLFIRLSIQNDAAYRLDFLLRIVVSVMHLTAELMAIWVIFSNTKSLNGWDVWQTLTLLGVYRVMVGTIGLVIAPNMRATMDDIRQGGFDYVLLRPLNSQFHASMRKIVLWRMIDILLGLALAIVATWKVLGRLPIATVAAFILMLGLGVIIVYSIWLIVATSAFWFTRVANIEMIFWNVFEVGRYPVSIYPPWLRWLLTFVLPMAFVTTFPAEAMFGRLSWTPLLLGMVFAPLMLAAATLFWRTGVRRYSGASA